MHCCVPFCKTNTELDCGSEAITFHELPSEERLRAAWLSALGTEDTLLPDSAMVCSQHFLDDEMYETGSGLRQIYAGAIPSTVQVCMMCLDAHSKLFQMKKYKLEGAYENFVGLPLCNEGNLKQTLCILCAQRLMNFTKFRDKSLRARALMMDLVEKHKLITLQHMELMDNLKNELKPNIVKTVLKPDHCDLYITHSDEDKQTENSTECNFVGEVAVKNEVSHDTMSTDNQTQPNQVKKDNGITANSFNPNIVILKEEYMSDDSITVEPKQFNDPLLVKPSTSKELVESLAQIKYEITFECTTCFVEFADEDTYNNHMAMHIQNQNPDRDSTAEDYAQGSVAPLPWGLAINETRHAVSTRETMEPDIKKVKLSKVTEMNVSESDSVSQDDYKECEKSLTNILYHNLETSTEEELPTIVTNNDDTLFSCKLCEYKTTRKGNLKIHMKTHSTEKPFSCQICEYEFARNCDLARHMKTHLDVKPFSCKLCDYKCKYKNCLVEHMKIHSGEKPYSCKLCEYKFARKSDLVRHMKTHTGEKSYSCEFCDHKVARNCDLATHMLTHTGEKRFTCQYCDFKFARKGDLVNHTKIHTGEKPFACNLCEYKCNRKKTLVDHIRTHTGDKPFSCEMCGYKCINKNYLSRHMKTHSGDRPFTCELCDYKFARNKYLIRHMQIVHDVYKE